MACLPSRAVRVAAFDSSMPAIRCLRVWDSEVVPLLKSAPGLRPVAIFDEIRRRHPEIGVGVRRNSWLSSSPPARRNLQEDGSRPMIYNNRAATCSNPQ
jgi:hypothetical protein